MRSIAGGTGQDDADTIQLRLQRARSRAEGATYGGPEWDAAQSWVDDLERELRRIRRRTRQRCTA